MQALDLGSLRAQYRGELIQPHDGGYDSARKLYNGMINRHPRLIARCSDAADVVAGVNFARQQKMLLAVRGGGHNGAGLGCCDDGMVLDLSRMRRVEVDTGTHTVRVQGGCVWNDVDKATGEHGMATPSGIISSTGVGGLTLGGGIGHLTRKFGLTIDSLLAAEMVLADGSTVTASEESHPDLFWAIRGGGGNFGVVTTFTFQTHDLPHFCAGPTLWSMDQAAEVLRKYREFLPQANEDINGFFAFMTVPPAPPFPEHLHMKKMCGVVWAYTGDPARMDADLAPMRKFGTPAFDHTGPVPHATFQSMFDALYSPGLQWYWRADFVKEIPDDAVDLHVRYGEQLPTMHSTMHLYPIDGAAHRKGRNDTAFSFRDAHWAEVIVAVDPNPANNDEMIRWCKSYWEAVHPFSEGGAYVNFMMDEGVDRIRATYRDNYDRLMKVKRTYDPGNLFQVNQNIRPAAAGRASGR